MPELYRCLADKPHALLSYQTRTAQTAVYAPGSTWTSGRNKLVEYVKTNELIYDWYIFLDEDIVFYEMTQKDGFEMFLSVLASCDYPIVTVNKGTYNYNNNKARFKNVLPDSIAKRGLTNPRWAFQSVDWFDGLFNAFSREAFFGGRLLPYTENFDSQSWWISQFVMTLHANHHYRNRIVQCNNIKVRDLQSAQYPRGYDSFGEAYRWAIGQLGVGIIEMSAGEEIELEVDWRPTMAWRLRCFGMRIVRGAQGFCRWFKARTKTVLRKVIRR